MNLFEQAYAIQDEILQHRRYLHQHAEVGMKLPETTKYVKEQLEKMGYEPKDVCESGLSACIGKEGKTILLRADMDALPVKEESGLCFASETGCAHACGHDMHAAMMLGVAKLLKNNEDKLNGTVKLMFQPAEEIFEGAQAMIAGGIMENPKVDRALTCHVRCPDLPTGELWLRTGNTMASCNGFKITITGKGCHGAYPQEGVDPINIGMHIAQSLQSIVSREAPFTNTVLITLGSFVAGTAPNIIPQQCVLQGTIRTFNEAIRKDIVQRVITVAKDTATMFRGSAEVEILSDVPSVYNDPAFTKEVKEILADMPELDGKISDGPQLPGSEDFAIISSMVPSVQFWLGATTVGNDFPQHHPKVEFDEAGLPTGVAAMAKIAFDWLNK